MSPMTLRRTLRRTHIVTAAVIGTYLYSPWSANPVFAAITLWVVFPLMAFTGMAMWQQGRIAKWLK